MWDLPPQYRLRKGYQYREVRTNGKICYGRFFHLSYYLQEETPTQCGFIISKKVGKAVLRNRLRRTFRELYRHSRPQLLLEKGGYWLVIICKPEAATATGEQLQREWVRLTQRVAQANNA